MGTFVGLLLGLGAYVIVTEFYGLLKPKAYYPGADGQPGDVQAKWYELRCAVQGTTPPTTQP